LVSAREVKNGISHAAATISDSAQPTPSRSIAIGARTSYANAAASAEASSSGPKNTSWIGCVMIASPIQKPKAPSGASVRFCAIAGR
jgi:hypothetical protein